jgi:tetratricopeptide (TPR) repeat protein
MVGRSGEAVADATRAVRSWPCPANQRLLQRALLAARRYRELELDRPDEIRLYPVGGSWLAADLRSAAAALAKPAAEQGPEQYRALLNRTVILSALGEHAKALQTADAALALAPLSPQVRLARARVRHRAADPRGALAEVEEGLRLQPHEAGLLEIRGVIRAEAGDLPAGLADLEQALMHAPDPLTYAAIARILSRSGNHDKAVYQWSLALRQDPGFSEAYLGRALSYAELRIWERALADLEQASTWVGDDLKLQLAILQTYARCLSPHPESRARFWTLAGRTARLAWERLAGLIVHEGRQAL